MIAGIGPCTTYSSIALFREGQIQVPEIDGSPLLHGRFEEARRRARQAQAVQRTTWGERFDQFSRHAMEIHNTTRSTFGENS